MCIVIIVCVIIACASTQRSLLVSSASPSSLLAWQHRSSMPSLSQSTHQMAAATTDISPTPKAAPQRCRSRSRSPSSSSSPAPNMPGWCRLPDNQQKYVIMSTDLVPVLREMSPAQLRNLVVNSLDRQGNRRQRWMEGDFEHIATTSLREGHNRVALFWNLSALSSTPAARVASLEYAGS